MLRTPPTPPSCPRRARVAGRTRVPGDKSISHRYACSAQWPTACRTISGYSPGADCAATLACLRALGVAIRRTGDHAFEITGPRPRRPAAAPAGPLDAVNSGTTMRLLSGILAAHPFQTTIGGDRSLQRRPMRRIIDPLTRMGARIESARRPPAADHRRRRPRSRSTYAPASSERAGQERRAAGRTPGRGPHDGRSNPRPRGIIRSGR